MSAPLRRFPPRTPDVATRLTAVCFPAAGGGATTFATWRRQLPEWIDLHAYVAPGREERAGETPLRSVEELMADVLPAVRALPPPAAVVGHSFGAWLAYELTHQLVSEGHPPCHLVVLAAGAPGRVDPPCVDDDRDLEAFWIRLGADTTGLARPGFRAMVFPVLRADIAAQSVYRPRQRTPLPVSITVLHGDRDPSMTYEDATAWRALSARPCRVETVPGGHFFPSKSTAATVGVVVRALSGSLRA
jgi:pyochelin biosynthetic protein PchC